MDGSSYFSRLQGDPVSTTTISNAGKLQTGESYNISTTIVIPPGLNGSFSVQIPIDISNNVPKKNNSKGPQEEHTDTIVIPQGPFPVFFHANTSYTNTGIFKRQHIICELYNHQYRTR